MKGRIMDSLIKDDGMTKKDFSSFKDGVVDRDWETMKIYSY